MRSFVTAVLLACASSLIAQTDVTDTPAKTPDVAPKAPVQTQQLRLPGLPGKTQEVAKTPSLPPNAPVVTLQGVCRGQQLSGPCKTVVTREELDRFVNAFAPDVADSARGRMAIQYARTVAYAGLAEQQGLEKNPALAKELEFQLKLTRMRVLANAFTQILQGGQTGIAEAEIKKYYDAHKDRYEQVQVRRLAVPASVPTESGHPLERAVVQAEMEELRTRAVAGEDFNQLQQDAFKHLHIQAPPPPVGLSTLRRGSVQGDEAKTIDLNPGDVSAVLDLPAAMAIVKVETKELVPIDSVRQEIEYALRRDHMQDATEKLTKKISAQFNLQYLGLSSEPDLFGPMPMSPAASRKNLRPTIRPRQ
jgi:hypothetical protein